MKPSPKRHGPFDVPKLNPEDEGRDGNFSEGYRFLAVMMGRATSQKAAMGRVVVVKNREDMARVRKGDIVASRAASPCLSMIMSKASAIITEQGGRTAIAAKLAMASDIPALVGVAGLMETIAQGDLVRVDGTKETVEILEFAA